MGVISFVGKVVLLLVNTIMLILALIMGVCGIVLVAGQDFYTEYLKDDLEDELLKAATQTGVTLDTSNMNLADLMLPIGVLLILFAALIAGISIVGLIGAYCTIKVVLIVYAILVTSLLLGQLIFVLILYFDEDAFNDIVKPYLRETTVEYQGLEGTNSESLVWNAIMNYEDCCGIDSYNDFHDDRVKNWPPATINGKTLTNQKTPVMCCKTKSENYACAEMATATDVNNNQSQGCYKKIYDTTTKNEVIITMFVFSMALELLCSFFSIWIICTMDNIVDII